MIASSVSLGVLIGVPIIGVILLICAAVAALGLQTDSYGQREIGIFWAAVAAALLTIIIAGALYWPWRVAYHVWTPTSGRVASISSRLLGSSSSFQQKFVVRFTDGRERGCTDTRCSLVHRGDFLALTCKRQWQFAGRDGWDCQYVDHKPAS